MTDYAAVAEQAMQDFPDTTLAPLVTDNPDFEGVLAPLLEHFWKVVLSRPLLMSVQVSRWHLELAYAMGYAYGQGEKEFKEMFEDESEY